MTKFILHGGATSLPSIHNKNFFAEIVKSLPKSARILNVYFAIPKEKWKELLEDDKRKFFNANPDKKLEFSIANQDIDVLIKQISSVDAVYIRGGKEVFLYEIFGKIDNLAELFQGKVVVGSSAGAYVLSKYFYSDSRNKIEKGAGILPVKVLAHWSEDKVDKLEQLKKYKEDLEVYAIPETEFVVIEK